MTEPFLRLQAPDWAAQAALAIAEDLCERSHVQDAMLALDRDTRHEMVVQHAHRIRQAWRREMKPEVDRAVAKVLGNLDPEMRARLEHAEAFSRAVYRLRPDCWHVAMIDAHGPGAHQPPRDPAPAS